MRKPFHIYLSILLMGLGLASVVHGIALAVVGLTTGGVAAAVFAFIAGISIAANVANGPRVGGFATHTDAGREDTDFEDFYLSQGDIASSVHGTKVSSLNDD